MITQTPQKSLVELVIEAMIKKLANQKEFEQNNIEALTRLAKVGSLTKSQPIIDAIKLDSRDQHNEATRS